MLAECLVSFLRLPVSSLTDRASEIDCIVRKFFIIYVARDLRLIFPSASATAITIRSLHLAAEGDHKSSTAQRKMKALSLAFVGSMGIRVASQYAIGLLWVDFRQHILCES